MPFSGVSVAANGPAACSAAGAVEVAGAVDIPAGDEPAAPAETAAPFFVSGGKGGSDGEPASGTVMFNFGGVRGTGRTVMLFSVVCACNGSLGAVCSSRDAAMAAAAPRTARHRLLFFGAVPLPFSRRNKPAMLTTTCHRLRNG